MSITTEDIKKLRDKTGISIMQCKKALEEAGGDAEKAIELLKKGGAAIAAKKASRDLGAGTVAAYIHNGGAVGAMCELLCETDFVARNEEFQKVAYELAMQTATLDDDTVNGGVEVFLEQPYIKDPSKTIEDLVQEATQKFGERVEIGRFTRFAI